VQPQKIKKKETNTYVFKAILLLISCSIVKTIVTLYIYIYKTTFNYAEITT